MTCNIEATTSALCLFVFLKYINFITEERNILNLIYNSILIENYEKKYLTQYYRHAVSKPTFTKLLPNQAEMA